MNTTLKHLVWGVTVLLLSACAKENSEPVNGEQTNPGPAANGLVHMTFNAVNVKTALGEGDSVLWVTGDKISIFDGEANRQFSTNGEGASASFTGDAIESATYYALYPYDATASLNDGKILLTLPQHQTGIAGSFGDKVNYSAAKTTSNSLQMRNLGGLLAFTLTSSNITSVTLRGNNEERLAGPSRVSFDGSGIPGIESTGSGAQHGSLILTPASPASTFTPGEYFFFMPETAFSSGVTLVFSRSDDNKTAELVINDSFTVSRSHIADLSTINTNALDWNLAIRLVFIDHKTSSALDWPFTESRPSGNSWAGTPTTLTMTDGGYTFTVSAANNVGLISGSAQGFKFGTAETDYLRLPVPGGYSLDKVTLVSGNYNSSNAVTLSLVDAGTSEQAGSSWTNSTSAAVHTWDVADNSGASWQIMHDAGHNCSIQRLALYYRPIAGGGSVSSVSTLDATDVYTVAGTSATLNGSFTASVFSASAFTCGFEYKTGENDWTSVTCGTPSLSFSYNLTGLTKNSEYTFRAWAKANGETEKVYGASMTFKPSDTMEYWLTFDKSRSGGNIWDLLVNKADGEKLSSLVKVYGGYTYELRSYHSDGYGIRHRTSGDYSGLCMNHEATTTPVNSWIKLPAIPSFKLTGLGLGVMDSSSTFNVSSSVSDVGLGNADILAQQTLGAKGTQNYYLSGTTANTSYYLCSTKPKICYLYLKLSYKVVAE